jgi:hypothetical protein
MSVGRSGVGNRLTPLTIQNTNFIPTCICLWSYPLVGGNGSGSGAEGLPAASVVTMRFTPETFSVLNKFFASKKSSIRCSLDSGMKRE